MTNKLWSAIAAGAVVFATLSPAFAVCNPGTPNCIKIAPGGRLAQLKDKLNNPGTLGSGDIDCQNSKLCGIDTGDGTSPGALTRAGKAGAGTSPGMLNTLRR